MRLRSKLKALRNAQLLFALVLIAGLLLPAIPAGAIVGSTTEDVGADPDYPYVGGVWRIKESGLPLGEPWKKSERVRTNGILIADNVVLTDGGSYQNGQRVAVSFASPIPQSDRKNPVYQGHLFRDSAFDFQCPTDPDPDVNFEWCGPVHDAAVIILDESVAEEIPRVALAGLDSLNEVDPLTAVSYGPTTADSEETDFTRRITSDPWHVGEPVLGQPASAVRLEVPNDGFTCFGDNGGPVLQGDDIVALIQNFFPNEDAETPEGICGESDTPTEGVAYGYRLDTQEARDFLCMVGETNFATVEVDNPLHPGQTVPYSDLTGESVETLVDRYCPVSESAVQAAAMDDGGKQAADNSANQRADRQHKHKNKHGGDHRHQGKHRH